MRNLHVWSDSTHIGVFSQRSGGSLVRFEYDDAKGAPISLSLPRTGAYSDIAPKAFLENLLPESRKARWRMADRLGVDSVDTFDLLAGVDVTGGLVFTPSAEEPSVQGEARPLDDDEPGGPDNTDPRRGLRVVRPHRALPASPSPEDSRNSLSPTTMEPGCGPTSPFPPPTSSNRPSRTVRAVTVWRTPSWNWGNCVGFKRPRMA